MFMKRITVVIGISLAVMMALSVILPALGNNSQSAAIQPTAVQPTAIPTFPPPPRTDMINFDQTYMHPSGIFTIAEPSGWVASEPQTTGEGVRAVLSNLEAQSLIQVDVDQPVAATEAPLTLDDVDARFNDAWLSSSWREYSSWNESSRERTDDERVIIDFELTSQNQTYVARQSAWTDGEWIYSVRVVTPDNATETLLFLLDEVSNSLQPLKAFAEIPFNWEAYFDATDTHIIRYPATWFVEDSAPGRPTSISGDNNTALRVESAAGTIIESEEAAADWVESLRSGTTILSVEPVAREENAGYSVTYSIQTADGDKQSGEAVLLNGPDEKLHVANLRFPGDVNLHEASDDVAFTDLATVMDTFYVFPQLAGVDTTGS